MHNEVKVLKIFVVFLHHIVRTHHGSILWFRKNKFVVLVLDTAFLKQ